MPPSREDAVKLTNTSVNHGCVDFVAYCANLGGWIACGWIAKAWQDSDQPVFCSLDFGEHHTADEAIICLFPREDVDKIGSGFLLFLQGDGSNAKRLLLNLRLRSAAQHFRLVSAQLLERPTEAEAVSKSRAMLAAAPRSRLHARLTELLNRPVYTGRDTLDSLQSPVFLEIDAAVLCPPDCVLLRGWFIDPFHQVTRLRFRCGPNSATLDPAHWIRLPRADVYAKLVQTHSSISEQCGFMAFAGQAVVAGEPCYIEIETASGEYAFKRVPPLRSPGLATIKDMLGTFDLRYQDMVRAYDHVVGPAIDSLNAFRLAQPPEVREMQFGTAPVRPDCSIIIPLYGRIDFMEYQLAFFARSLSRRTELIYVLDDPSLLRAAENLATACLARFGLPFRLLTLSANVGYAPANNIGLSHARADNICFLNSDVFPKRADWLKNMLATLGSSPTIGMVGALLLFEDDTIQHEGCAFTALAEFGGWQFCLHPNKGRAVGSDERVTQVEAVTGACLVMRTDLARALGGFDEGYVIGDFEDMDLCRQVQARGLICVVDRRAQLYHLERQSQGGQVVAWRLNLTLYNAWRFQSRWPVAASGQPWARAS